MHFPLIITLGDHAQPCGKVKLVAPFNIRKNIFSCVFIVHNIISFISSCTGMFNEAAFREMLLRLSTQVVKQLPRSTEERLSNHSSDGHTFNLAKPIDKKTLKDNRNNHNAHRSFLWILSCLLK